MIYTTFMKKELIQAAWYIACQSKDLKQKPLKIMILDQPLVLFRNQNKKASALLDRCPHRNAPLSKGWVRSGELVCPYHGWRFSNEGHCTQIPGRSHQKHSKAHDTPFYTTHESHGLIWIYAKSNQIPTEPPYALPEIATKSYRTMILENELSTSLHRLAENFLDGTHTHFVHNGLIRKEQVRKETQVKVVRTSHQVEAQYINEETLSGLIVKLLAPGSQRIDAFGRFLIPGIAQLEYRTDREYKLFISACITPISENKIKVFSVMSFRWGLPNILGEWLARPLFYWAIKQDKKIMIDQAKTIADFEKESFVSTELDLLGPHIIWLLNRHAKNKPPPADHKLEKKITLWL